VGDGGAVVVVERLARSVV